MTKMIMVKGIERELNEELRAEFENINLDNVKEINFIGPEKITVITDNGLFYHNQYHGVWEAEGTQLVHNYNEFKPATADDKATSKMSFEELKEKFEDEAVDEDSLTAIEENEFITEFEFNGRSGNFNGFNWYTAKNEDDEFDFYSEF